MTRAYQNGFPTRRQIITLSCSQPLNRFVSHIMKVGFLVISKSPNGSPQYIIGRSPHLQLKLWAFFSCYFSATNTRKRYVKTIIIGAEISNPRSVRAHHDTQFLNATRTTRKKKNTSLAPRWEDIPMDQYTLILALPPLVPTSQWYKYQLIVS